MIALTSAERARWLSIIEWHERECASYQACCEMATSEATTLLRRLCSDIKVLATVICEAEYVHSPASQREWFHRNTERIKQARDLHSD